MSNKYLEVAEEIAKIAQESNRPVLEIIEEYKKAHNFTDQSKSYEHDIENFNVILPDKLDLHNNDLVIQKGDM